MNCENRNEEVLLVNSQLRNFVNDVTSNREFISLGQNCSTSWYLKAAGLKNASYPFDWIFSSTEIVIDCIKDEFTAFIDRSNMIEHGSYCEHLVYHKHFFYHRNPLSSGSIFSYYQRCCKRFNELAKTDCQPIFVITLLPEVDKRKAWRDGFTQSFSLPSVDSEHSILKLSKLLESRFQKFKLIVIEQWTEAQPNVTFRLLSTNTAFVKFSVAGTSGGVRYQDVNDDKAMITLLQGLKE